MDERRSPPREFASLLTFIYICILQIYCKSAQVCNGITHFFNFSIETHGTPLYTEPHLTTPKRLFETYLTEYQIILSKNLPKVLLKDLLFPMVLLKCADAMPILHHRLTNLLLCLIVVVLLIHWIFATLLCEAHSKSRCLTYSAIKSLCHPIELY